MPRFILGIAFALAVWSVGSAASAADFDALLPEMALGSADAPLTIYEHSSLTCGHCANFHRVTLPEIKKAYIDTGKVRLVFRDFPLDNLAYAAALLPHCAGPQRYFGFLEVLFRTQETWAGGKDPLGELKKVARLGGLSAGDFEACLGNQPLFAAIRDRAAADGKAYAIEATPTFRIGNQTIVGGQPFDAFKKLIDEALKASK
ncbi:DsbA family protein [Shumkonia mesophila]|uniref:DsbA family protein n=1 Tax=Shumkonia mesophila TaxID=2838854 RepID=UPI0029350E1A|nr:DsbA family protein [Shumkonia mesophila]